MRRRALATIALAAFAVLCYWPSLRYGFLTTDATAIAGGRAFALERALGGGPAWASRAIGLAVHVAGALAVGALAARLAGEAARWPAAFLYVAHPLAVDAVARIGGRGDSLVALLAVGAAVGALEARARRGRGRAVAAATALAFLGALAFVCAPAARTTSAASEYEHEHEHEYEHEGDGRLDALTAARAVAHDLRLTVVPSGLSADATFDAFPRSRGLLDPPSGALALAGLAALAGALALLARRGARVEAALGLLALAAAAAAPLVACVAPALAPEEPLAERHAMLAVAPVACLVAGALAPLLAGARALAAKVVLGVAVAALAVVTLDTQHAYRDDEALAESVVAARPACVRAEMGAAAARLARGDATAAIAALDAAIDALRAAPSGEPSRALRGPALLERAQAREAILAAEQHLKRPPAPGEREAIEGDLRAAIAVVSPVDASGATPRTPLLSTAAADAIGFEARLDLGALLCDMGRAEEGRLVLAEAAGPTPTAATERAWDALGRVAIATNDLVAGERTLRALADARLAGEKQARYRLAEVLDRRGDLAGARAALDRAIEIDPRFAAARYTRGDIELRSGELEAADQDLRAAIAAHPGDARVEEKLREVALRRRIAERDPAKPPGPAAPPVDPAVAARRKAERLVKDASRAWRERPDLALAALRAADDEDRSWGEPAELMGALFEELDRPEDACVAYERALAREPDRVTAKLHLDALKARSAGKKDERN